MKRIHASLKWITAVALLAVAAGCTSEVKEKENLAVAAGFKVITPSTPAHQAMLANLPAGKVTRVQVKGKIYYVLPDAKNNQAYVGGPKQYEAYKQLRLANKLSNENLEAAEMNEAATMNWTAWGGWGVWGGPGFWY